MWPATAAAGFAGSLVLLALLGAAGKQQQPPPPRPGETSARYFKNIRVLKKLPADQLVPTMQHMSRSLGVRCDFCHVVNANHTGYELDIKPAKEMARKMIVMTEGLNAHQKILDGKATCYMCHRGQPVPVTELPAEPGRPRL